MDLRGKRRTKGQRIGEVGEAFFKFFALKRLGLLPNSTEHDYGLDAVCQVVDEVEDRVLGPLVACQVKASAGVGRAKQRVTLTRADAEALLGCEAVVAVIGIDVEREAFRFRLLDERLVDELVGFLATTRESVSWSLTEMKKDRAVFRQEVLELARPARQYRLRLHIQQKMLDVEAPGAELEIQTTMATSVAILAAPWLGQLFSVEAEHRDTVRSLVFDRGAVPSPQMPGLKFKGVLGGIARAVDGPVYLQAGVEASVELVVEVDGRSATADFTLRRVGDERAYVHPAGVVLVVSDARRRGKAAYHDLDLRLFTEEAVAVGRLSNAEREFFSLFRNGARLNEKGRPGIALEHWGPAVRIGPALLAVEAVRSELSLDEDWRLGELANEEFATSVGVLEAVLVERRDFARMYQGFLLGPPAADASKVDEQVPYRGLVPLLANLGPMSAIVWFEVEARAQYCDGYICGFMFDSGVVRTVEIHKARLVDGGEPELWFTPEWPAIPLSGRERQVRSNSADARFKFRADLHPVEKQPEA